MWQNDEPWNPQSGSGAPWASLHPPQPPPPQPPQQTIPQSFSQLPQQHYSVQHYQQQLEHQLLLLQLQESLLPPQLPPPHDNDVAHASVAAALKLPGHLQRQLQLSQLTRQLERQLQQGPSGLQQQQLQQLHHLQRQLQELQQQHQHHQQLPQQQQRQMAQQHYAQPEARPSHASRRAQQAANRAQAAAQRAQQKAEENRQNRAHDNCEPSVPGNDGSNMWHGGGGSTMPGPPPQAMVRYPSVDRWGNNNTDAHLHVVGSPSPGMHAATPAAAEQLVAAAAGGGTAAGVIFGCNNETFDECFELSMVGLPRKYLPLVQSIRSGHTLIFIFNFSSRMLHGVYRATSDGGDNLHAAAFTGASPARDLASLTPEEIASGSPFPAQCCFSVVEELAPCPEAEFRHVLEYTERQRFRFKLSRWQCEDLISAMARHEGQLRATRIVEGLHLE